MVADDNGDITYESTAGLENGSRNCQTDAINEHCIPTLHEEVRKRSGRAGEGRGEGGGEGGRTTLRRGRGSTCSLY